MPAPWPDHARPTQASVRPAMPSAEPAGKHPADGAEAGNGDAGHGALQNAHRGVLRGPHPGHKCKAPRGNSVTLTRLPTRATLPQTQGRTAMLKRALATGFGALLATTLLATAQNYPNRPVTMIIPFAAGGPTDVLGRVVGQRMSEILGQQIVIENVGGAGGHDRLETRRRRGTGRLHHSGRHRRHPCPEPDDVQKAALQFGHRLHAGRACWPRCRSS